MDFKIGMLGVWFNNLNIQVISRTYFDLIT